MARLIFGINNFWTEVTSALNVDFGTKLGSNINYRHQLKSLVMLKLTICSETFCWSQFKFEVVCRSTEAGALLLLGKDRKILILSRDISKFKTPASVVCSRKT